MLSDVFAWFLAVAGTIVLRDYTEAGTIVFLFTIAEWLESRASHKVCHHLSSPPFRKAPSHPSNLLSRLLRT